MAGEKILWPCLRNSPEVIFSDAFIVALALSRNPTASSCFVFAWRSVILEKSAFSSNTFLKRTEHLYVIIKTGTHACLAIISTKNCPLLNALELDTGYPKAYFDRKSIAVMIVSKSPLVESSGSRSICTTSSVPKFNAGILVHFVVCHCICLEPRFKALLRTWMPIDGEIQFCLVICIVLDIPGCFPAWPWNEFSFVFPKCTRTSTCG